MTSFVGDFVLCSLDPKGPLRSHVKDFITIQDHYCEVVRPLAGRKIGPWYGTEDYVLSQALLPHCASN